MTTAQAFVCFDRICSVSAAGRFGFGAIEGNPIVSVLRVVRT